MRTMTLGRWTLVALALMAFTACGDGEGDNGALAALGVKDGASKGVSKSAEVTADKAATLSLATGAKLEVPKGAVEKDLTITMERPADGKALDLVEKFKKDQDRIASAPYVLKPHGTQFQEEVIVTLPLSKGGAREVSVAWLEDEDDTEWKSLGVAKSDGKSAQIAIKHFSVLVVVEDASDLKPLEDLPSTREDAGAGLPDAGGGDDEVDAASELDAATESDAGAGGSDRDASVSVPVDAAARLDADTDGGMDATAPVADAGSIQLDTSTEPDVTDPNQPDAGDPLPDTGVIPDEGGPNDAALPPDAGPPPPTTVAVLYAKLLACDRLGQTGSLSRDIAPGSFQACTDACHANGTCDEAQVLYCNGIPVNDGGGLDPATVACLDACYEVYQFSCPDAGTALRCDNVFECFNGEDEQGCGGFQCGSGETVSYWAHCSGYIECTDGSDEVGCFECDSGWRIRPEKVCDGVRDCADQTDESTNCAAVACPIPG